MVPRRMRTRILKGPILNTLLVLAGPIVFNQLVQVLYNLIDTFWLGRLGRTAISAPVVSWPIVFTIASFAGGFAAAGLALVSQYVGANRWDKVNKSVGNILMFLFLLSIAIAFLGFVYTGPLLMAIRTPHDVFALAKSYLSIIFLSLPFMFVGVTFSVVMRAVGDTMTPMKVNVFTLILNGILDPILIFGLFGLPRLGVEGAAIATGLSNAVTALIAIIILAKGWKHIHVRFDDLFFDKKLLGKIIKIGLPSAVGNSLNGLAFAAVMTIVGGFGSVATAAYGITIRLINIISSVSFGISQAASIMIGQNIGAEQYERAKKILKTAIKFTFVTMTGLAFLIVIPRYYWVRVFISDPNVIMEGAKFILLFSFSVPFFGIFFPVMQALRAAGKTKRATALAFIRLWVMRVPFAYAFSVLWHSMNGIWFGMSLANILGGLVSLYFIFNTRWVEKVIE